MSAIAEVEVQASRLTARERGELITKLLRSLPDYPAAGNYSIAEAVRRREQLRTHPEISISLDELDRRMQERLR